ncbi:protein-disulfide reductase DsbD domain-containing protein [Massilia eburnea]|uniref:protein-disulfide reductase DsbD domain-containing protein n=1 Tax=Massilia eburnea TaxID=1776165 RepID=UPI003D6A6D4B
MKFLIQWLAAVLLASALGGTALADDFLAPERAFGLRAELRTDGQLALHWTIAQEYHLYRDRITVRSDGRYCRCCCRRASASTTRILVRRWRLMRMHWPCSCLGRDGQAAR